MFLSRSSLLIALAFLLVGGCKSPNSTTESTAGTERTVRIPAPRVVYSQGEADSGTQQYGPQAAHERMERERIRSKAIPGAQLPITFGSAPNDHTGMDLRTFAGRTQTNFTEIYGNLASLSNTVSGLSLGGATTKLETNNGTMYSATLGDGTAKQSVYLDANKKIKTYDGVLNALAYGVVADGSTDNTSAFAAIDASTSTNLVIHFPKGQYRAGYTFTNLNLTFEGEGRGTVFIVAASTNAFRFQTANQRVAFRDLQIDMRGTNKTAIYAVSVADLNVERIYVQRVGSTTTTNANDGISFTSPTGKLTVRDSEFYQCERDGVIAWPAAEIYVENSIANGNGRGGFVCDKGATGTLYDGWGALSATYVGNTVTNCQIGLYTEGASTNILWISTLKNRVLNCGQNDSLWAYSYAITAGNHTAGEIRGNYVLNFGQGSSSVGYGNGIDITGIDSDVTVSGNTIVAPRGHGILANNGATSIGVPHIGDNRITDAGLCGIFTYGFDKVLLDLNRVTNSVQNAAQINTCARAVLIGNKFINSSRGTNDAYSGVRLISSIGVVGIGNEIDSATQLYALEHDAASFPKSWIENRESNFHTAWITNAGGTTGGNIFDGHREFVGTSTPTIVSPNAGDYVRHASAFVNARKGWIYGSDSAWHEDWPVGNRAMWLNTNGWNGVYTFTAVSPDANAFYLQRSNSIANAMQITLGSTTNAGSGIVLRHMADTDGDGAENSLSYLNLYGLGMAYNNASDQVVFFADQVNRRVGIKNASPSYELDVTGDINFTGTLRQNGSAFYAGATGAGVTNQSGTISANLVAGSNVTLTTGANGAITVASAVTSSLGITIDGAGSAISTGTKGYLYVPYACTINSATLLADQSGSIVVDVWKCTYSQFDAGSTHPVSGDKITLSTPPTITSATKAQDTTLTGWNTSISAGDVLAFNVNSASTVTRATLVLKVTK